MRKPALFLLIAFLAVAFVSTAGAVERDYRLFLKDGSWVQILPGFEVADGKVKVRLRAGQLAVFSEAKVDLEGTENWNDAAAEANITTQLPLSKNLLHLPVVLPESLHTQADLSTEGDPRDRLWQYIRSLDEKERQLTRERSKLEERAAATEDRQDAVELYKQINELTREINGVRARRNGSALQLKGWAEQGSTD